MTRRLALLGLAGLLAVASAGCQRTIFATPPVGPEGCDARLVGHWQSLGDDNGQDGELEAWLSPDCSLRLVEHGAERTRTYPTLRLATGGGWAWVDAAVIGTGFDVQRGPLDQPGAVYVFAWSVDGDIATLTPPAHRHLARQVLDREIEGAVLAEGHELTVRVDGDAAAIAAVLAQPASLDPDHRLRFRRGPERAR